ncbi:putative ABC transporter [Chytriomyces sp. MP71]|nr:putative ABC transporter [Chytriomyces sp. MP71]
MAKNVEGPKHRIVSMLPSASEMICLVGGESELVGRSHEDDFPATIMHLPILTGQKTVFTSSADVDRQVSEALTQGQSLYTIDADTLKALKPTAIVTQDLCNVCAIDLVTVERISQTMSPAPHIITLNPQNLDDVISDVRRIGEELGYKEGARKAQESLQNRIEAAKTSGARLLQSKAGGVRPRVLFIEWTDPIFFGGHWTPQLIHMAGADQPIAPATDEEGAGPSRRVTHEACIATRPQIVVICPCGLSLVDAKRETDLIAGKEWFLKMTAPDSDGNAVRVVIVDGNQMFNRPGPRLVDALEFLVGYIWDEPELIPAGFPYERYLN